MAKLKSLDHRYKQVGDTLYVRFNLRRRGKRFVFTRKAIIIGRNDVTTRKVWSIETWRRYHARFESPKIDSSWPVA